MGENTQQLLAGQYPTTWDEYVGQDAAKEALSTVADSARLRGERMRHILITSPYAGIGKTALGLLVCRYSGKHVKIVSGGMKMADALEMFEELQDDDIVLYDEFHQIANGGPRNYEWLLHYLENGTILTPYGEEEVPRVTFVAMTTDKGMLLETVLDRFMIVELEPYTDDEGADIAAHLASKVMGDLPEVGPDTAVAVAAAGSNRPRRMRDLLESLRDLAVVGRIEADEDGDYPLDIALRLAGLTPDGLTKEAVTYLTTMRADFGRQSVGEGILKARLGYKRGKGLEQVESLLSEKGLIAHTKQGRMLTSAGSKRARQLAA